MLQTFAGITGEMAALPVNPTVCLAVDAWGPCGPVIEHSCHCGSRCGWLPACLSVLMGVRYFARNSVLALVLLALYVVWDVGGGNQ